MTAGGYVVAESEVTVSSKVAGRIASLPVAEGDLVAVKTRRGEVKAKARVTDKVKPGVAFMPFHYSGANIITSDALDPVSKIPEYKIAACRIEART